MANANDPSRVHCYTNPSFCRQSEFMPNENNAELPPPLQFQGDDLPLPPPPPSPPSHQQEQQQQQQQYGQNNAGFHPVGEPVVVPCDKNTLGRYVYLNEQNSSSIPVPAVLSNHRRYASLPVDDNQVTFNNGKYDYIVTTDDPLPNEEFQRHGSSTSRYAYLPNQQVIQCSPRSVSATNQDEQQSRRVRKQNGNGNGGRYAEIPGDQVFTKQQIIQERDNNTWINSARNYSPGPQQLPTSRGRYARVPLQEEDPPALPERNVCVSLSPRNNHATQKLHEILTTPRKPRSRSEERTLSPKRQFQGTGSTPQRRALTPGSSPSGRTLSPGPRGTPQGTPQSRAFSPNRPQTSTPNKEPSARRCLPLTEVGSSRLQDVCPASNCGKLRYVGTAPVDLTELARCEPPPRYAYLDSGPESLPMICSSPRYQVVQSTDSQKRNGYQSVESAFVARTAVVPPLSPPNSDANTTLASGLDKNERRNAPLLLVLVGVLTCGLSLYLSWTQGRRYYFDSAAGCGACCALAGACRTLKRTWTGLGLAALSALSCGGLLLLAAKAPRSGTPLHDVTAGALCGVSLLGAALALLALIAPRCDLGRHRRVHSWIPHFSP